MQSSSTRALVSTILQHPEDHPWTWQGIGLLGLRLDDRREFRLHVWDPTGDSSDEDPVIHDHPYDFTSEIVAGAMTNTRYTVDAAGEQFTRYRYLPADEGDRVVDTVRLAGTSTVHTAGDSYEQSAHELHDSRSQPGTVSIIRCTFRDVDRLTVCRTRDAWVSGGSRTPTPGEVKRIAAKALQLL